MIIAVEGIIGSGKSTISIELAAQLNGYYYDCDTRVKELYKENKLLIKEVNDLLKVDSNKIDIQSIKVLLFSEVGFKKQLEDIVYKHIEEDVKNLNNDVIIIDGVNSHNLNLNYDLYFVMSAKKEDIINRVQNRDSINKQEVEKIITFQLKDYLLKERTYFFNTSNMDKVEVLNNVNKLIRGYNASENWKNS